MDGSSRSLVATPEDAVEGLRRAIVLATPPWWWGFYGRYLRPVHTGCHLVPTLVSIVMSLILMVLWIMTCAEDAFIRSIARMLLFIWFFATGVQSYEFSCRRWRLALSYVLRFNVPLFHLAMRAVHEFCLVPRMEQGEWDSCWRLEDLRRALTRKLECQSASSP